MLVRVDSLFGARGGWRWLCPPVKYASTLFAVVFENPHSFSLQRCSRPPHPSIPLRLKRGISPGERTMVGGFQFSQVAFSSASTLALRLLTELRSEPGFLGHLYPPSILACQPPVMAETAGLVFASIQLVDTVVKLKATLDGIENTPQRITDLVQEVDIIATQLSAVDMQVAANSIDAENPCGGTVAHVNLRKCAEYCRQALCGLSDLATTFDAKLNRQKKGLRRGIVMAKLFLQKDQIDRLQNKLDRTVQLLRWAQSCYVQAQLTHLV